jgi:Contact-dependent growth inhibition CdiA C-terminal domain
MALEIEGKTFEVYTPSETTVVKDVWLFVKNKISELIFDRFVVNMNESKLTMEQMTKQFKDYPIQDLKEIILIREGKVIHLFPFNK